MLGWTISGGFGCDLARVLCGHYLLCYHVVSLGMIMRIFRCLLARSIFVCLLAFDIFCGFGCDLARVLG